MSVQHTPGPWTIGETQQGHVGIVADGVWVIAVKTGALYHPRGDANARLIAAAPELLEALGKAASWLDAYADEHYRQARNAPDGGSQHSRELKGKLNRERAAELRIAIAKARGEA